MAAGLTAIRPRKLPIYPEKDTLAAISTALEHTGKDLIVDFKKTTSTWSHKPDFRILESSGRIGGRFTSIEVGTDDPIFIYVDLGTKPHVIRAKQGRVLAFKTGFIAKTRPNRLLAQSGRAGAGPTVYARQVKHPGNKARNFSKMIQTKHQKRNTLAKYLQAEFDKLAASAGS